MSNSMLGSASKSIIICALAIGSTAALAASPAAATDGYFAEGYGTQSKGLAGAVLAYPQDSLVIATNPAATFSLGNRLDVDIDDFQADRTATVAIGGGPEHSFSGNGGGPSPIPEFGFTHRIDDHWALGLAVYGNGGMTTDYKTNPFAPFGASGAAGVALQQVFISPTAAYQIAPGQSVGVALDVGAEEFKAHGIQPFSGFSVDPAHFSNVGTSTAWGYGAKIGYLGQWTSRFSVGAFYQSRTYSGKFSKYAGLFADGGSFDIPSTYGVGVAFKATDKLDLVGDVRRIDYSEIASVGHPLSALFAGDLFGSAGGPGFGWRDVTAIKLGINYRINTAWQIRAGYGYATNPVPSSQTLLNILAPAVVTNQFTVGATWTRPSGFQVSVYALDAPKNSVTGSGAIPGLLGGGNANIALGEAAFGIGFGWKH